MDLTNLKPAKGSVKKRKRIGRGEGSGYGGTSTKGHKGAKSRAGYKHKPGFEGGQMPIQRRVPKFGFKNLNRKEYTPVNLETLNKIAASEKVTSFDKEVMMKHGLIKKNTLVKILARGKLEKKIEVKADAFSESAKKAIEDLGGKAIKN